MSTLELKSEFHKLIDRMDDEEQLRAFYELMSAQVDSEPTELTEEEIRRYEKTIADFKAGKGVYFTTEQVITQTREWLKKRNG